MDIDVIHTPPMTGNGLYMFIPPIKKVILGMDYEIMLPTLMVVIIMVNIYISVGTSPFFMG